MEHIRDIWNEHYLKQSINITSLGSPYFDNYFIKIEEICQLFVCRLPQGAIDDWNFSQFKEYPVISVANRYYTNNRDMGNDTDLPFGKDIDPHGILEQGKQKGFVHLVENTVEYCQCSEHTPNC